MALATCVRLCCRSFFNCCTAKKGYSGTVVFIKEQLTQVHGTHTHTDMYHAAHTHTPTPTPTPQSDQTAQRHARTLRSPYLFYG